MGEKTYNFRHCSILLIDDNRFLRQVVADMCRGMGFGHITQCDDGSKGFQELQHHDFDYVVCDWIMQPMDGLDFTRLVRTAPDSPNVFLPIIMLTGYTEFERVGRARDAGVTEFLAKPISPQGLLNRLIHIIEKPRPFVKIESYFGPDRRRHHTLWEGEERRQANLPPFKAGEGAV